MRVSHEVLHMLNFDFATHAATCQRFSLNQSMGSRFACNVDLESQGYVRMSLWLWQRRLRPPDDRGVLHWQHFQRFLWCSKLKTVAETDETPVQEQRALCQEQLRCIQAKSACNSAASM